MNKLGLLDISSCDEEVEQAGFFCSPEADPRDD